VEYVADLEQFCKEFPRVVSMLHGTDRKNKTTENRGINKRFCESFLDAKNLWAPSFYNEGGETSQNNSKKPKTQQLSRLFSPGYTEKVKTRPGIK
jgi:hypothetical protein